MRLTDAEIMRKVEEEMIAEDPRLADEQFRRRMSYDEKVLLISRMMFMANRLKAFPY